MRKMYNLILIAGARPNFMKIAPIYRESLKYPNVNCKIVHTGQHYDYEMSQTFFEDLELPEPHFFMNAGSGSHAQQTAKIMITFEKICQEENFDRIIVVGDVNSTFACTVVAKKMNIRVAHVEAGLRSFDMNMPEEINRILTDSISDHFFVTENSGMDNLLREGKRKEQISFVGNVMIDNLLYQAKQLKTAENLCFSTASIKPSNRKYIFLTLHRPSNVDDRETFTEIISAINNISEDLPILFPIHPRTRKQLEIFQLSLSEKIIPLAPLGFRESLFLWKDACLVMTDSGGLQEETTALGVPCFTLRENTERPVTIEEGTNTLVGTSVNKILSAYKNFKKGQIKKGQIPQYWDGKASQRIFSVLLNKDI